MELPAQGGEGGSIGKSAIFRPRFFHIAMQFRSGCELYKQRELVLQYPLMDFNGLKGRAIIARLVIGIAVVVLLFRHPSIRTDAMQSANLAATHGTYTTNFPLAEDYLSEGGKWTNGQTDGLDWTNVRTTPGFAFGTELGGHRRPPQMYDDSTALLTGTWGPDQTAQATVRTVNPNEKIYEEVELRLRSALFPHRATGYEILFRASKSANAYCEIVRWNGPLGDFTYLGRTKGPPCGVATGDVVKATIKGSVITAYINGTQVVQATDSTYTTGNPGIGLYLEGASGVNGDYGFASFTATDQ